MIQFVQFKIKKIHIGKLTFEMNKKLSWSVSLGSKKDVFWSYSGIQKKTYNASSQQLKLYRFNELTQSRVIF